MFKILNFRSKKEELWVLQKTSRDLNSKSISIQCPLVTCFETSRRGTTQKQNFNVFRKVTLILLAEKPFESSRQNQLAIMRLSKRKSFSRQGRSRLRSGDSTAKIAIFSGQSTWDLLGKSKVEMKRREAGCGLKYRAASLRELKRRG